MDTDTFLAAFRTNAAGLAAAARAAGPDAPVPTCPEWRVSDLLDHIRVVHSYVDGIVASRATEPPDRPSVTPLTEGEDAVAAFEAGAERLLATLEAVDVDAEVWNWSARRPAPVTFWHRRMAHEIVIHRVDAESAAGRHHGVEPPELAVDGIDEYLDVLLPRLSGTGRMGSLQGTFHFHATDVPGEWQVEIAPGRVEVLRRHAKAPVAVRGPASDLELLIYNRRTADGLEVFGDAALLDGWREAVRI
jgi:uncharacterized protein (TIGR03083 family)